MSKRVRITLEGGQTGDIVDQQLTVEIAGVLHTFGPRVRASKGFKLEEIEKPLAVGDRVTWGRGSYTGEITAIKDGHAALWHQGGYFADAVLGQLRRAE